MISPEKIILIILSGNIGCDANISGRMSVCANLPADFPGDYIVIASSHLSLAPWVESHHHRLSVSSTSKVNLNFFVTSFFFIYASNIYGYLPYQMVLSHTLKFKV